ncbi:Hint domain-containing protein [Mesorhizobium sp. NPDC059025]|uniref:Hint domain-containing protein n=1 Tax=unclassified Mesorhizobium TaxID=325217 RepID=UPI00366A9D55
MSLVNIGLLNNGTTTINSQNWNSTNTLELNLVSNGTLIVDGVDVKLTNILGGSIVSSTTIQVVNGANLVVDATVADLSVGSNVTYGIGQNTSVTVNTGLLNVGLLNATTINFANAGGTGLFKLDPGGLSLNLSAPPKVLNVQAGNRIEVVGSSSVTQIGNTVTFFGGPLGILPLASYTIPAGVTYSYQNSTDTLTFTSCFLRGTRIKTPEGEVAVEELKVGDLVIALNSGVVPIKWVGRRRLDPKSIEKPRDSLPIRVRASAIAENVPSRDLYVSPDHCMFLEKSLIPAKLLINGATVTQEVVLTIFEYYHIELDCHDVILAEGAQTETYLDLGGRNAFHDPGVLRFGSTQVTRSWNDWCYPPVYAGDVLDRARATLARQAEALGYAIAEAKAS